MEFKTFLEQDESYAADAQKTIRKLPKSHQKLVKGYKFKFQPSNTLKGDGDHVGYIDEEKKEIVVAAPWNYGREYTFLHEVAHLVWKYVVNKKLRHEWGEVVKKTKEPRQHQGEEELFCMAYANFYAKNKIVIHTHDNWEEFIKRLPKWNLENG